MQEIARALGISVATLYNKQREYLEFLEAVKRGRAKGVMLASSVVFDAIRGVVRDKDGKERPFENPRLQVEAAQFWLRTRAGWKDIDPAQVSITVLGPDAPQVEDQEHQERLGVLSCLTIEERRQLRDMLLKAKRRAKGEIVEDEEALPPIQEGLKTQSCFSQVDVMVSVGLCCLSSRSPYSREDEINDGQVGLVR